MKNQIVAFAILFSVVSAVPISRQLGGVSNDVHVRTVNGTQMCQLDGQLYKIDEDLPTEDPCEYCTCQPPGFACQVVKCEHKPECRALQRSGLCCPEYICDCEFKGKIYQNGERISDNDNKCEDCYCVTGEVVCSVIQCAAPPENCEIVPGGNRCCPTYRCPDNVDDHRKDDKTRLTSLIDDATIVEAPQKVESIGTETPQVFFENNEVHFENEDATTIKSQVGLDESKPEYLLLVPASESGSDDLKVKEFSGSDNSKPETLLPPWEENETAVEEKHTDDANFNAITDQPKIVDSVRIEEGSEVPTENRNEFMSFIEGTERNVEVFDVATSVPEVLDMATSVPEVLSEVSNKISMISLEFNDALNSQNEDSEAAEAVPDISNFEATERNVEEVEMSTDNPRNKLFNEQKVIKSHEESHKTAPARNEDTTAPSSVVQLFDNELHDVTVRSTEEEAGMLTFSHEDVFENVHKIAKIKLNLSNILKSQDENYATVRSTIEDSGMKEINDQVTFSSENIERFEVTERSVEEMTLPSMQLEQESVYVNKDDKEFALNSKDEETTAEPETRKGDEPVPNELQTDEMEVTERNADVESMTEVVNKIAKIKLSESEREFLKSQETMVESSTNELEAFDGEVEEFLATERSVEDLSMTTLQPEEIKIQALKFTDTDTEIIDKREESLNNLESVDATERTADEELSTAKPSLKEDDIVVKLAKTELNNKEQFDFTSTDLDFKDITTELIESRIQIKEGLEMTTEYVELRTEKYIELADEILEFGIKDIQEEVEALAITESTLYDSGEVNKSVEGNIPQMTSPDSSVIKSDVDLAETNNSTNIRNESTASNEQQKEEGTIMTETTKENREDDKLEYWINMGTEDEQSIQDNQLTEKVDTESTTIKEGDNFIVKEDIELKRGQNSVTELERDDEAAATESTDVQNDEPVTEVPEAENKPAIELQTLRPKKQRTQLHEHLSKKFGLRPLTRRTFSNDIEKRRTTRLRDRKMIVGRNRQNAFH